jgi:hypothetical protein
MAAGFNSGFLGGGDDEEEEEEVGGDGRRYAGEDAGDDPFYGGSSRERGRAGEARPSRFDDSDGDDDALADPDAAAGLAPYVKLAGGRLYARRPSDGAALRLGPDPGGDPRTLYLTGEGGSAWRLRLARGVPVEGKGQLIAAWRRAFADPGWEEALEAVD